ncbi:MAG: AMP-binding protein [Solirubrobacteraceae bacterium]
MKEEEGEAQISPAPRPRAPHRFDPAAPLALITEHQRTYTVAVITAYKALMRCPGFHETFMTSLRAAFTGCSPMEPAVAEAWRGGTGVRLHNACGLPETTSSLTLTIWPGLPRLFEDRGARGDRRRGRRPARADEQRADDGVRGLHRAGPGRASRGHFRLLDELSTALSAIREFLDPSSLEDAQVRRSAVMVAGAAAEEQMRCRQSRRAPWGAASAALQQVLK